MNENARQLRTRLESVRNDLWQLQNALLQLSIERTNWDLARAIASELSRIATVLEPVAYPRLVPVLNHLASRLGTEAVSEQTTDLLFGLVEALASLHRDGEESLDRALSAIPPLPEEVLASTPAEPPPIEPPFITTSDTSLSSSALEPDEGPKDSYDGLDEEDLGLFCSEARDHLQAVEGALVEFERTQNPELIAEVFRAVHSTKGGAQYIGLNATAALSHRLETLLDQFRKGGRKLTRPVMSTLLESVDGLALLVRGAEAKKHPSVNVAALIGRLDAAIQGDEIAAPPAAAIQGDQIAAPPATIFQGDQVFALPIAAEAEATIKVAATAAPPAPSAPLAAEPPPESRPEEPAATSPPVGSTAPPPFDARTGNEPGPSAPFEGGEGTDLELFSREFTENAASLHELLADLNSVARDTEKAKVVSRNLHSLKGIAGFIGLPEMERVAAELDMLLERVFRHRVEIPLDIRRISADTLDLLESLHREFREGGRVTSSVEALSGRLASLTEREERMKTWAEEPAPVPEAAPEAGMLRTRLEACEQAISDPDPSTLTTALADLEDAAMIQGYDELSDATNSLRKEASELGRAAIQERVASLEQLLPADTDLLGLAPASSSAATAAGSAAATPVAVPLAAPTTPPSSSGLGPVDLKELEALISEEHFDQDLVRIYVDTTSERTARVSALLDRTDKAESLGLLSDLSAAASYMGYEALHRLFETARGALDRPRPDTSLAKEALTTVAAAMDRLRRTEPAPAPFPTEAPESARATAREDATRTFLASARTHLGDLLANVLALSNSVETDRLSAIHHLLDSLHSSATSAGYPPVAAGADHIHEIVRMAAVGTGPLDGKTVAALVHEVESLYRACGLTAPPTALPEAALPEAALPTTPPPTALPPTAPAPEAPAVPAPMAAAAVAPALLAELTPTADESPDSSRNLVEAQATVRVDTKKIDGLMNMVAELVVNRSSFLVLSSNIRDVILRLLESGHINSLEARNLRHVVDRYDEATTDLGRVSNQLQEGVMRIRMMPVRTLLSRVPRLVRDLAVREHRLVRLSFSGEETELDKTVIEQLSDPLVHLLRNAISHGIEPASERLAAGKPAEGTIHVAARHQGNMVIIEVSDDGHGIDFEAIRRGIVERGLGTAADAARLSQRDLLSAIFLPGFSTSRGVSDLAGRGVGLDVVKRNIEGLGGQIEVTTEVGKSTRFSIRIPLTMAIMQALLIRVADEIYSIPVSAVIQTVKLSPSEIASVEGQEVVTVRNKVIPIVRLTDVFEYEYHAMTGQLEAPGHGNGAHDLGQDLYVVILQGEGREFGIAADGVVGSQDLVIKSLEDELVDARGVTGAAILGDGRVTLILDIGEVQKMTTDRDRYSERRVADSMRQFERYVRERPPMESGAPN